MKRWRQWRAFFLVVVVEINVSNWRAWERVYEVFGHTLKKGKE